MSENSDKEIVQTPKRQRSPFFWGHIGILLSGATATVLIIVIMLACYASLMANKNLAISLAHLTNRFDQATSSIADAQNNAMNAEKSTQQTNEALKAQSQIITDIQKTNRTNKDDFLLAESFYLLKMASDHLQYERNIPFAITLLQSADQDISKLSDPRAYPVRQAMAADLVALQSAPRVDVAGIYLRLSAVNNQLDQLPLMTQLLNPSTGVTTNTENEKLSWWRRGLNSLQLAFQRIVVVRKNVPNEPPFVAPDQQILLYQNLHAELETAQWGLLHRQPDIYRSSLLNATNWIKKYAVQDASMTKQILQNLEQLQQVNVYPNVPTLTISLQALQNYMSTVGH